ncbi:metallophosphoesterase family protein [Gynurincola endophyticus]|jgi:putative phosphoesterase|uniref:metallophosphoesterase family protein n=1 Tax=Gynurincola endophyticus TaxID=2479004 RepID=UPI000F8E9634|nr:metallophosphoesterase family protein [Gynurincola endophyticus]
MTRIGIISDTHSYLDPQVFTYFKEVDEIWHAGDFGSMELIKELAQFKPLKGVYGNIDNQKIRNEFPENLIFTCEQVKVLMTHIGGYPPKYNARVKPLLQQEQPQLFIDGHSHILKIMFDEPLRCLHINPGAAGKQGWHKVRTLVRLSIDGERLFDCEVIELGAR